MEKINYFKMVDDFVGVLGEEHKSKKDFSAKEKLLCDFYSLTIGYFVHSTGDLKRRIETYQGLVNKYPEYVTDDGKIDDGFGNIIYNPDIATRIEEMLKDNGFNFLDVGTQYLKRLIEIIYHERELYYADVSKEQEKIKVDYFNLNDFSNVHYKMLGVPKEKAITDMILTIYNNKYECGYSISDIVYECADKLMYYNSTDRENIKRKRFSK